MKTKFEKVNNWTKENVLAGFEILKESNKYERLAHQISTDGSKAAIRVATSNLKFIEKYDSYVADSDNGVDDVFGQKWFKRIQVLKALWFGYYVVIFDRNYFKGNWEEIVKLAKEQEECELPELEIEEESEEE